MDKKVYNFSFLILGMYLVKFAIVKILCLNICFLYLKYYNKNRICSVSYPSLRAKRGNPFLNALWIASPYKPRLAMTGTEYILFIFHLLFMLHCFAYIVLFNLLA